MPRRMGPALLAALRGESGPPKGPRGSVLGNPTRRRVLQYWCLHPCGPVGEAAKDLGLSPATVRFHARRLAEAEYLAPTASGFAPLGLVDPGDLPLFAALASAFARRVLAAAYAEEGIAVGELASALRASRQSVGGLLDSFQRLRLVSRVADGRFVRVYPTAELEERRERNRPRAKHFCDVITKRLAEEGERPQVLRLTATELQVRFGRGAAKATLILPIDPHGALLR